MLAPRRIDLKRYFLFSGVSVGICFLLAVHHREYVGIVIAYGATLLNQWMLMEGLKELFYSQDSIVKRRRKKFFILYGGKLLILFVGLAFGVHFMGKRVIIPLANYLAHIFILFASFKRGPQ